MLEIRGLSVSYGLHRALDNVALQIAPGEIVVILGANGAGKTTLLNAIAGVVPASAASQILLEGTTLRGVPLHEIVESGLSLVPEGRAIFGDLTVRENLLLGAYARRARQSEHEHLAKVLGLFPKLAERSAQTARTMSGGEQQMVAIGKAMMSAPSILMLDEPSLGLSPLLCSELFKALGEIRKTGVGILLVEQNARQALAIADRGYILENGHIVGEGLAASLARDPAVQLAYLGGAGGEPAMPAAPIEQATTDATARATLRPAAQAEARGADAMIHGSIAELVNRAVDIQAEQLQRTRAAKPAGHLRAATGTGGTSLDAAIAGIEAAAANARTRTAYPGSTWNGADGERTPEIEAYRRSEDGKMVRVKGD
jgi:branched-chain amino acid transport system ATP-binding protein